METIMERARRENSERPEILHRALMRLWSALGKPEVEDAPGQTGESALVDYATKQILEWNRGR